MAAKPNDDATWKLPTTMKLTVLYRDDLPSSWPLRIARWILRGMASVWLLILARLGRRSLVDAENDAVVVSLTSYGARVDLCHLTIESIGRGSCRPGRLILWLEDYENVSGLPATLQRAVRRGLEVRSCKNFGPHTKYHPAVQEAVGSNQQLVTADDDVLYPRYWLAGLQTANRRWPDEVPGPGDWPGFGGAPALP
jgi:hypothetical protein